MVDHEVSTLALRKGPNDAPVVAPDENIKITHAESFEGQNNEFHRDTFQPSYVPPGTPPTLNDTPSIPLAVD
jgi:hypothetical protein